MKSRRSSNGRRPESATKRHLDPELLSLMGLVEAKRHDEVEALARRILNQRPNHSLALKALSFALISTGRHEEALPLLEFAVSRYGTDPELHNNLGIARHYQLRWEDAVLSFRRGLELAPKDYEIWMNLGNAYAGMRRWNEAVPPLLKAIELHPGDYVEAVTALAATLINGNRADEALVCLDQLHEHDPDDLGTLYLLLSASLRTCLWKDFSGQLGRLRRLSDNFSRWVGNPFAAFPLPDVTGEEQLRIAHHMTASQIPKTMLDAPRRETADPDPHRRLRIGYLSADFREHPVGYVLPELIERHSREGFEIVGYSLGKEEKNPQRERLVRAFDGFVDIAELSVREIAGRIASDRVDILVDLMGWTADGRPEVLALRPAPVQAAWLGFPGTLGHPCLADYLIGDPVITPLDHAGCFSETLALLPNCYLPADSTRSLADPPSREAAGLPTTGFVFCSFNNSFKYNPGVWDLWCSILAEAPDSVLWLSAPSAAAQERLRAETASRGVSPERIVFASRTPTLGEHLARLQLADLALDPFPYNSHSTGLDALWAGVPMVSLLGATFPGRVGASELRAVGLSELVCATVADYRERTLELFRDHQRLAALRCKLVEGRTGSALFDMSRFVRDMESLYRQMWQDHLAGRREPIFATSTP